MIDAVYAEKSLAGALLLEPVRVIADIRPIVSESDFLTEQARAVFIAAKALTDAGAACDPVTIKSEAQKRGTALSDDYLRSCMVETPTAQNSPEYARIIHDASVNRSASEVGLALAQGEKTPLDAVADLQSLLSREGTSLLSPSEAADQFYDYLAAVADGKVKPFLPTGFPRLDRLLAGGLASGGLITIAARPGTGKTTAGLCIAENVAAAGGRVLYISLELPRELIMSLRCANLMSLPRESVQQAQIENWGSLADALQILSQRKFWILDKPSSVEDIEREARCIPGLSLLVVDHVGLIRSPSSASRYEVMTAISHRLKQLALSMKIPVLALCQLNRESEKRQTKRPSMADLRDSGAIEEDSDAVCLLFRPPEDEGGNEQIDFILDKNRHGRTGIVTLGFDGALSRIMD